MPQRDAHRVVQGLRAWEHGDRDQARAGFDPDVEYSLPYVAPGRGLRNFELALESWRASFEGFRLHFDEVIAADEHVVLVTRQTGTGRESKASVELTSVLVFTLRDSRVIRVANFETRAAALEAVGLPPS
jgi:ketosteroid isomerase-like protein